MHIEDIPLAYELSTRLLTAQQMIAHLDPLPNAGTVPVTIDGVNGVVTVGPLLCMFHCQMTDVKNALTNLGVKTEGQQPAHGGGTH